MIGYVTLGTKDIQKAAAFYDKIAAEMGIGRFLESDTFIAWGSADGSAGLGITRPFDGKPMSVGNGVMVALAADDKAHPIPSPVNGSTYPAASPSRKTPAAAKRALRRVNGGVPCQMHKSNEDNSGSPASRMVFATTTAGLDDCFKTMGSSAADRFHESPPVCTSPTYPHFVRAIYTVFERYCPAAARTVVPMPILEADST